jgi:DNA-binding CsgD family transcriptional regulator
MREVLTSVRAGMSGALVVRGEPGIGKTALLDDIVACADEFDVLRIVGIESEMSLGFAALHQLVRPLQDGIGALPDAQADALRAALGMGGGAPEPFRVALATLTLLSTRAMERGLVIVVDDAHWLDFESERVIGFVGRRLHADRIALFIAIREPVEHEFAIEGLPSFRLEGLTDDAALELMSTVVDDSVDELARDRVIGDARGNPLAIVEMIRELADRASPGAALQPQPVRLDKHLQALFLRQVHGLPPATRRLLLTAAADPTGDAVLLWRAGHLLDFDEDAAKAAEAADLISFGPPISFRHPLIRGAVYHGAADSERRLVHAALADAIGEDDPDRCAWHRAAATLAPDEEVAAELEATAARASLQGGFFASAALLRRAAELTPDATSRGLRLVQAAASDFTAGQYRQAHETLDEARPLLREPFVRAQTRRLEGAVDFMLGTEANAPALLLQSAFETYEVQARLARETVLDALRMSVYFGEYASAGPRDVAIAAKKMPLPPGESPSSKDLTLDALAELYLSGPRVAAPLLRNAMIEFQANRSLRKDPGSFWPGIWVAFGLSDHVRLRVLTDEFLTVARSGALASLQEALQYRGLTELMVGTLPRAAVYFAEEHRVQQLLHNNPSGGYDQLLALAWRGNEAEARASASKQQTTAHERSAGFESTRVGWSLAILDLGLGNYEAAAVNVAPGGWMYDIAMNMLTAADAVEAHVRNGAPDHAEDFVSFLEERSAATEAPIDLGLLARSRALLSPDRDAEACYTEAIIQLSQGAGPLHVARARLVYGEWLRRQRRRRDAREQLRTAFETFSEMAADAFAERARKELLATGETARKRVDETRHDLTPQEAQIAALAAAGATNHEIASRLFVSPGTVDFHLRKVYRKLGISSRKELPALVDSIG